MRFRTRATLAASIAAAAFVSVRAQAPAPVTTTDDAPAFDVVSIKPNTQGAGGPTFINVQPGGRFVATNIPLVALILQAYRLQTFQLVNAPAWARTERFDVEAKASGDLSIRPDPNPQAPPGPLQLMLRAMLADRFKLKAHTETRDAQTYDLVFARADKKLGPKIMPSTVDCAAEQAAARARGDAPSFPQAGQPMRCGMRTMMGNISAGSVQMPVFATQLGNIVGQTVTDRTGLTGNYDINLTFTPDRLPPRAPGTPDNQPITVNGAAIDPNGPTIYTALQEQLGLKLEPVKSSVNVLVVDSVDHPTPD